MFDQDKGESDIDIAMDLSDEDKSMRLYETLEQIGVCERRRLLCREWIIPDITESINLRFSHLNRFCLHFGSSIEGSSVSDLAPDVDIAMLVKGGVINDASDGKRMPISHLIVPSTFPGYVKLQMLFWGKTPDKNFSKTVRLLKPDKSGRFWLMGNGEIAHNAAFMDLEDAFGEEMERYGRVFSIHGPAKRTGCIDIVWAFECYDVLNIIPQWVSRKRLYNWPSDNLRKRCLECPTLLVKVGHPYSEEKEIEWRISFSLSERELMFSLNPTQHKCYVTLKMIKHDLLNQALSEEFITSYHLKTCVFWAVENTPEEMWRPEQLLRCVSICLWYLLYFVLIKNCPNYFLPAANLFQRPAFQDVQPFPLDRILDSVTGLVDVICSIKCADVGHLFKGRFSTKITEINDPCSLDNIAIIRLAILYKLQGEIVLMEKVEAEYWSIETRITRWKYMLKKLRRMHIPPIMFGFDHLAIEVAKNIMTLQINLRLALCFAAKAIATQDESQRLQLIKSTMDCSSDLFTARLTYLTLLFKLNRLSECDVVLKYLLKRRRKSKMSVYCQCKPVMMPYEYRDFIEHDITTLFTNQVTCMIFMPKEQGIVPEPLDFELNLPIDNQLNVNYYIGMYNRKWVSVDGWVYFLFMGYLVYSGLNDVTMKEQFLWEIGIHVASGKLFHHAVTYNLMGWICAREGMLTEALKFWRTSLERHQHRNAVNRYCVDFFSKCIGLGKYINHN